MLRSLTLALLGAALTIAACQPVPRPFQPEDKRLNAADFARLGTRGGIIVRNPEAGDSDLSERLAGLLAAALRDANVPALAGPHEAAGRYVLTGSLSELGSGGEIGIHGTWTLADPLGKPVGRYRTEQRLNAAGWRTGDPGTLALVAQEVAGTIAASLNGKPTTPQETAATIPRARLAVWSIEGLEDDQAELLANALRSALRVRGLTVAAVNDPAALVVTGWVDRTPINADSERIEVGWALLEPDGREIGVVSQGNEVRVGTLDGMWADAAPTIASAAADGLVEMLARHARRK